MTNENELSKTLERSRKLREESAALRAKFEEDSAEIEAQAVQDGIALDVLRRAFRVAFAEDLREQVQEIDRGIKGSEEESRKDKERWENAGMPPETSEPPKDNPDTSNTG